MIQTCKKTKSRYNLHKALRDAKGKFQTKLESKLLRQPLVDCSKACNAIMDCKAKLDRIVGTSLRSAFNAVYAHFEQQVSGTTSPASTASGVPLSMVTAANQIDLPESRKQLLQMEFLAMFSKLAQTSWQKYSQIYLAFHYFNPKSHLY